MEGGSTESETETLEDLIDPRVQVASSNNASSVSGSAYENEDINVDLQPTESTDDEESEASLKSLKLSDSGSSAGRKPKSKRRRQDPKADQFYNNCYRELLNDTIREVLQSPSIEDFEALQPSQIGVTKWSPQEKGLFFHGLSRSGKDNIHGIAMQIGTKSEMEVRVYMQLLQTATVDHQLLDRTSQVLTASDLPAAVEVSNECVHALDEAAEALRRLQNRRERRVERRKHGELWRLNSETASWVEESLADGDEEKAEISRFLPATDLLNLHRFVELSTRVFMNSAILEDNWQSIALKHESPSLMYTAFSDFHTLAVSLTKRLVQASLYFAMSRRRSTDKSRPNTKRVVKRRDVVAALQVLGAETDPKAQWIGMARRCNLNVFENLRRWTRTGKGDKLSYKVVEKSLRDVRYYKHKLKARQASGTQIASELISSSPDIDEPTSSSSVGSPSEADREGETPSNDNKVDSHGDSRPRKRQRAQGDLEKDQDDYMKILDEQASLHEEQRLWQMLEREPPAKVNLRKASIPKRPTALRGVAHNLEDWRNWLNYKNEWEVFATPVPLEAWTLHRRKRRRSDSSPSSISGQYLEDLNESSGNQSSSDIGLEEAHTGIHQDDIDTRSSRGSGAENYVNDDDDDNDNSSIKNEDAKEASSDAEAPDTTSDKESHDEEKDGITEDRTDSSDNENSSGSSSSGKEPQSPRNEAAESDADASSHSYET